MPKKEQRKSTGFEDLFGRAFNQDTNKKIDEFMNDLKVDLSQFSTRMTGLMNTTFSKLKDMDIDSLGSLSDALDSLYEMIENDSKKKDDRN